MTGGSWLTLLPVIRLCARRADRVARLVTFGRRDFEQLLKAKFGLEDR